MAEKRQQERLTGDRTAGFPAQSDVSRAIYGAGFSSPSRVYEAAKHELGMTPARYSKGGEAHKVHVAIGVTPFGAIGVGSTKTGICSVRLADTPEAVLNSIRAELPKAEIRETDDTTDLDRIVTHIVSGTSIADLPLDLRGTAFQRKVWTELRRIPRGERRTYQQVADGIGSPNAVRAVANACGANPVALVVPCHRVVRTDGGVGGYRWGSERKEAILSIEQA